MNMINNVGTCSATQRCCFQGSSCVNMPNVRIMGIWGFRPKYPVSRNHMQISRVLIDGGPL